MDRHEHKHDPQARAEEVNEPIEIADQDLETVTGGAATPDSHPMICDR